MRFEPLGQKMFTRRNWLLRCSILINVAVILYIGSQLMIGGGNNFSNGGGFLLQEQQQVSMLQVGSASSAAQVQQQQQPTPKNQNQVVEIFESEEKQLVNANADPPAAAAQVADGAAGAPQLANDSGAGAPALGDPSQVIGNIGAGGVAEVNNSQSDGGYIVTGDEKELEERVRSLINCFDHDYHQQTLQRGDFWMLQTTCGRSMATSVTSRSPTPRMRTTRSWTTLVPLLERWNRPGKRTGYYVHWEPIYIGTHADPHYDERLSWEGKSDKMPQGYALCVMDYEFHILDNAFLVHKPGIKVLKKDNRRAMLSGKTNQLIRKIIYPELKIMYGMRKGCAI
ncbi:GM17997 [Drosophila sechellia]|uniref:GM17997 n=1 Tax=Drosophila sechellia TaxID=7238 RepID=B4I1K4_DROSE|nr:GM17997 [Drosophila sechellia]